MAQASKVSLAPGGPSQGRLGRQEARREAVLGARRPVGRPSWAPGDPSAGRLGRQEPRIVGFADSSSEIVGFAQSAGRAQAAGNVHPAAGVAPPSTEDNKDTSGTEPTAKWPGRQANAKLEKIADNIENMNPAVKAAKMADAADATAAGSGGCGAAPMRDQCLRDRWMATRARGLFIFES